MLLGNNNRKVEDGLYFELQWEFPIRNENSFMIASLPQTKGARKVDYFFFFFSHIWDFGKGTFGHRPTKMNCNRGSKCSPCSIKQKLLQVLLQKSPFRGRNNNPGKGKGTAVSTINNTVFCPQVFLCMFSELGAMVHACRDCKVYSVHLLLYLLLLKKSSFGPKHPILSWCQKWNFNFEEKLSVFQV